MVLFVSEICRLILGFLEQENLTKTFETFLNECKYLEECKMYHEKSLHFSKTINGKTLKQYLFLNEITCFSNASTQTDVFENLLPSSHNPELNFSFKQTSDFKKIPKITQVQSNNNSNSTLRKLLFESEINDNHLNETENNTKISKIIPDSFQPNKKKSSRKKSNIISKNKSNQVSTTPTKSQTEISFEGPSSELYYLNENEEQDINFEIDEFIENLCKNNFAEKLAHSINEINYKKIGNNASATDEGSKNFLNITSHLFNNNLPINEISAKTNSQMPLNDNMPQQIQQENNNNNNINAITNSTILENNIDNLDFELIVNNASSQQQIETSSQFFPCFNYPNNQNESDTILNKIVIGNEDISLLAEFYSEPATAHLFEVLKNNSRDNSLEKDELIENELVKTAENNIQKSMDKQVDIQNKNDSVNKPLDNLGEKENVKNMVQDVDSNKLDSKNLDETLNDVDDNLDKSHESNNESIIKYESETGDFSYSVNKTMKSFIIISKSNDLIERTKREILEGKITNHKKLKYDSKNKERKTDNLLDLDDNNDKPLAQSSEKEVFSNKNLMKDKVEENVENKNNKAKKLVKFNLSDSFEIDEVNISECDINEKAPIVIENKIIPKIIDAKKLNNSDNLTDKSSLESKILTVKQIEKEEIKETESENDKAKYEKPVSNDPTSGLKCLASVAADIMMKIDSSPNSEQTDDKKMVNEKIETVFKIPTPVSSPKKVLSINESPSRRSRTIRAILETPDKLNQEDSSHKNEKLNEIINSKSPKKLGQNRPLVCHEKQNDKANSHLEQPIKSKNKRSKRYFDDFYENIKDFDDDYNKTNDNKKSRTNSISKSVKYNEDSDNEDLPAIFSIARRRQEELKAKFKNKLSK